MSPWSSRSALTRRPLAPRASVLPTELLLDNKIESVFFLAPISIARIPTGATCHTGVGLSANVYKLYSRPHASGETFDGAGYLQPCSFNLVWRGTIPSLLVGPGSYDQPRTEPEFMPGD